MEKNRKLTLDELKVQSFVTNLSDDEQMRLRGATEATFACPEWCPTTPQYSNGCTNGYCTCEGGCSATHCR